MQLRPKTKKRLTILVVTTAAAAAIATAVAVAGLRRYENHLLQFRADGMSAYHHGDYQTAAKNLASYLGNDRVDAPAIFAYAISRSRLPRPDMSNLLDAKRMLNRYLELNPRDVDAEHQLLDIYQKLHYPAETSQTADDLLTQNPDDVPALSARLKQFVHDQKYDLALPISMRLNELTPFDLRAHETTFDLMTRTHSAPDQIIARGNQLLSAHPGDPRFQLVRAMADYFTGDTNGTRQWLRQAAGTPTNDTDFILLLAGSFDHLGMVADSRALLENAALQPNAAPMLKNRYAQRMWESGNYDLALAVFKNLNPADRETDSQSIGLEVLIRFFRDPRGAMDSTLLHTLRHRTDDSTAAAWILLLDNISSNGSSDIAHRIQNLQSAERLDPENPDIRFFLANQYEQIGETELALQCYRQTTQIEPEWSGASLKIARIFIDRQRYSQAAAAAQTACDMDPGSTDAKVALALARYNQLESTAPVGEIETVLDFVQELRQSEAADADLLAANVDLLKRLDRDADATNLAVTSTVDSPAALHQLARVDVADHLGIGQTLCDLARDCPVTQPAQALEQLSTLVIEKDLPDANTAVTRMMSHPTVDWQLALAQGRDLLGDPSAGALWQQLTDTHPRDLTVQLAAIKSPAVVADRALMDRTIDRVKSLSSDDAIEWKIARARWELASTPDPKTSANAAAALMAEVVRQEPQYTVPQMLWAESLVKLNDPAGAIAHLRAAAQMEPDNAEIKLRLSQLVTQQGQSRNTADTLPGF